jgi:hypothetical protein
MKSAAGRRSACVIAIARRMFVAYRAVRKPVSWLAVHPRCAAVCDQVASRRIRASFNVA